MKNFVKALALLTCLGCTPFSFGAESSCKEGEPNCKEVNPFDLCKDVEPSFDRSRLKRDDTLGVQYDSCIAISRIQCVEAGEVFLKSYKVILEAYTGNGKKDRPTAVGLVGEVPSDEINVNVFDNFRALKGRQAEIFKEIVRAQREFQLALGSVKTLEDAQAARENLFERVKSIKIMLAKASHHDRVFLNLIDQSEYELRGVVVSAGGVLSKVNCEILREPVDKIYQNSNEYAEKVSALKRYVAKSTIKRAMALEKFKRVMELAIYSRYAERVGKDLDQIMDELGAVFALDSLLWEVTEWWANATVYGLANRLHTAYLQYRKPLEILHSHMGRAEEFKARIRAIEGLDSSARDQAVATIDDKEKTIKKDLDFITTRGWTGQLERQKLFATKRDSLVPSTNRECHEDTAKFFTLANEALSFDKYELAEAQYKKHYDSCSKKG